MVMACGGTRDLPLHVGKPVTKSEKNEKIYFATSAPSLARRLVTDMQGLTIKHATIMAEDAINIEENRVIEYTFTIKGNNAMLYHFKVISTIVAKNQIHIKWEKLTASVTFSAQKDITVHARRRRRWIGGGRRRCATERHNRGITAGEIAKIQGILTAVIKTVSAKSASTFVHGRTHVIGHSKLPDTCPAWKPIVSLHITRVCYKKESKFIS